MAPTTAKTEDKYKYATLDSRTSSILLNFNLNLNTSVISSKYKDTKAKINETQNDDKTKAYTSLRSALQESYFTGCLKYGNNFLM